LSAKNNFGLDEEAFDLLKSKLKDGDTVLFEQIFLSHFDSCLRYIVKNYNATRDNAYDCVMQSLLYFRQKLVDDRIQYGNLRFLFTRMAANRYIDEHFRGKKRREKMNLEQWIGKEDYIEFPQEAREKVSKAINSLEENCIDLLKKHFYFGLKLTEIAEESRLRSATIRKRKQRCVEELRQLYLKEIKA